MPPKRKREPGKKKHKCDWEGCGKVFVSPYDLERLAGIQMNVFWLRFNPDAVFTVGSDPRLVKPGDRRREVIRFLDNLKSSPTDPPLQIGYACYNQKSNGWPSVCDDPEYDECIKTNVVCIAKGSHKLIQPQPFEAENPLFADLHWMLPSD